MIHVIINIICFYFNFANFNRNRNWHLLRWVIFSHTCTRKQIHTYAYKTPTKRLQNAYKTPTKRLQKPAGPHCEIDIDECSTNKCLNNGTCVDGIDSFSCRCEPGYVGPICAFVALSLVINCLYSDTALLGSSTTFFIVTYLTCPFTLNFYYKFV